MNLNRLQIFYEAAEAKNFSQAAARLNITQPAVSAQIRRLEENLGVKLFARLGKKVVLTEPGQVLLAHARRIFRLRDEAEGVMNEMRLVKRGTLRLGTARTYANNIMPPLLSRFQEAFPQVTIVLQEGSSLEVARNLRTLSVEVAVVAYPGRVPRVKFEFLKREDLVVIVAPDHPLAGARAVTLPRLAQESIIMREKGSGTRRVVGEMFARQRLVPRMVFETSNADVIKEQVAGGVGASFMTRSAVAEELAAGRLAEVSLEGETPWLDIHTAVLVGHELSRPARVFLDMLAEVPGRVP
jgi:DNA-binding transcriptional LysR family regulator